MPKLSLSIKTVTGGFQISKPCIVLNYWETDKDELPLLYKVWGNRKVDKTRVTERVCSREEKESESHPHRVNFLMYHDWDALIKDEKKFTDDAAWFAELEELKLKYPQFNQKQIALPLTEISNQTNLF